MFQKSHKDYNFITISEALQLCHSENLTKTKKEIMSSKATPSLDVVTYCYDIYVYICIYITFLTEETWKLLRRQEYYISKLYNLSVYQSEYLSDTLKTRSTIENWFRVFKNQPHFSVITEIISICLLIFSHPVLNGTSLPCSLYTLVSKGWV